MRLIHVALLCAAVAPTLATAQAAVPTSPALAVGPAATNILRTGTEIQLKMEEPLTTEG